MLLMSRLWCFIFFQIALEWKHANFSHLSEFNRGLVMYGLKRG